MLTSFYKTEAVNRIQQHRPYNQLASLNQSAIRPSLKSNGKGLQIMKILFAEICRIFIICKPLPFEFNEGLITL